MKTLLKSLKPNEKKKIEIQSSKKQELFQNDLIRHLHILQNGKKQKLKKKQYHNKMLSDNSSNKKPKNSKISIVSLLKRKNLLDDEQDVEVVKTIEKDRISETLLQAELLLRSDIPIVKNNHNKTILLQKKQKKTIKYQIV